MAQITQGSKEYFMVSVVDVLSQLNDLNNALPIEFDVYAYQVTGVTPGATLMQNISATLGVQPSDRMTAYCLVDTSTGSGLNIPDVPVNGWWQTGDYHLFIKFATGSEVPRKGPHLFTVVSGQ